MSDHDYEYEDEEDDEYYDVDEGDRELGLKAYMENCSPMAMAIPETTKEKWRATIFLPRYPLMSKPLLITSFRSNSITVGTLHGNKQCKRLNIFVMYWVMEAKPNFVYSTIYLEVTALYSESGGI
jgi:hypothetical protein